MVLVGKKATRDGSVLLAHNNDLPGTIASLVKVIPHQSHPPGAVIRFESGLEIPQVSHTFRLLIMYCYYGFAEGDTIAINPYGVTLAGGVSLKDDRNTAARAADPLIKNGITGYIRYIALQRYKTARECVEFMGRMYSKHGIAYPSGMAIADQNEIWYMEAGGGKCWAAQRVPDDCYLAAANGYRIQEIDFKDKRNFILPPYLKSLAKKKGLWKGKQPFNFARIFGGQKEREKDYYNARRIWRLQRQLTPSLQQDPQAFTHPVMLKPDRKVDLAGLFALLRDYYKGTPFDVSRVSAGAAGKKERAVGIFRTVHTDVVQLRDNLPPEIGAVMWAGLGSAFTTPYIPYYLGIKETPRPYQIAGPSFDGNSAFWHFRALTTLLELRFSLLDKILPVWQGMEKRLLGLQPEVERTALSLYKKAPEQARDFLTFYCNGLSLEALDTAKELRDRLHTHLAEISD